MLDPELVRHFAQAVRSPDPDLAVAALMIARVEYPGPDPSRYLAQLDFIGDEARRRLAIATPPADTPHDVDVDRYAKVIALNAYLFDELRFVGNEADYGDPRNSFLNEVIDRRTGIPITLISELRDRGLLAYHLKDFSGALRDLQAYLQLIPSGRQDDEEQDDQERIWEHVKTLRKRVASLN